MKFASLGSGSKGNSTIIKSDQVTLLLDCGFALKETLRRLERLGYSGQDIDAIVVTHEHADHIKGVGPFSRKFRTPVYMTTGTHLAKDIGVLPDLRLIENYQTFELADITVIPVPVPHDAREPAQYVFVSDDKKLGVLTDLGTITQHIIKVYHSLDAMIIEANHDGQMLAQGPYPPMLKSRVAGPFGHLSNYQTEDLLKTIDIARLQHLVVGHISEQNNSLECAKQALCSLSQTPLDVLYACQNEGFSWLEIR